MNKTLKLILAFVFLAAVLLSSCTSQAKPTYIEGEERDQIAAIVQPIAEGIVKAIETNDYAMFTASFDDTMRKALTEDAFATIVKQYGKMGSVESLQLLNIEDQGDYYGLNFGVNYAESKVTMRLVVKKTVTDLVSGLWFK